MSIINEKNALRKDASKYRRELPALKKSSFDTAIAGFVNELISASAAEMLLIYVSKPEEIETREIISNALKLGIAVAAPRCFGKNSMEFFFLSSLDELVPGAFGIMEPDIARCKKVEAARGICVTPALMLGRDGSRLGYGAGYYDRFLKSFEGSTVGLCYDLLVVDSLPQDEYDIKINMIITQNGAVETAPERT